MKRRMVLLILGLVLLVPTLTPARAARARLVSGKVVAVTASRLEIKDASGRKKSVVLSPETRYQRGPRSATRADLKPGLKVRVSVDRKGDQDVARIVRLAAARHPQTQTAPYRRR